MTDKLFAKIKKSLSFYSEGGVDNLCTMTETTLKEILNKVTKNLEQENLDLKNKYNDSLAAYSKKEEQLNKAKELLEDLYDCIPASHADYYKDTLQKVVNFLKESEDLNGTE